MKSLFQKNKKKGSIQNLISGLNGTKRKIFVPT